MRTVLRATILGAAFLLPATAHAAFHFMQIEQVTGGVYGDSTQQAIQLRLRFAGQNQVQNSRVRVFDAAGLNPVTIVDMTTSVTNNQAGDRVLILSPRFADAQTPTADFLMANLIPESYFAAGRMTFEADGGFVYWSFCWGGASYTGATTGATDNDADGNYGPCVSGPLPRTGHSSWDFGGLPAALSTNNAADYTLVNMPTFISNARFEGLPALFLDNFED